MKPYRGYTERTAFGICAPLKPVTFGKRVGSSCSGKQTTVGSGGFFVCKQQITRRKKGSQEDSLIFFTESLPRLVSRMMMEQSFLP
ncbi:hypothetical protein MMO19_27310, partial [Escherichia coli]|nr:hypothetical protein [Escherichia coli]